MRQQVGNFAMHSFDTYKFIKIIKNAGLTEDQAAAIVNTVAESREYDFSTLSTKDQLKVVEEKILTTAATKDQLQATEEKLTKHILSVEEKLTKHIHSVEEKILNIAATKDQLKAVEERILSIAATKDQLQATEEKLTKQIHSVEVSLLKWVIPLLITIIGMFGTVIFKLFVA